MISKKNNSKKIFLFNLINLFLVISTILVTIYTLSFGTVAGQVDTNSTEGWFYIVTFTVESNIFLGITALISLFATFRLKNKKTKKLSKAISNLYLVASTITTLTMLVVLFYLAPLRALAGKNYFDMLLGPMFFFHFFNPLIASLSFIFLLPSSKKFNFKSCLYTIIPIFAYGLFYFLGIFSGLFADFYSLTFGGRYELIPVSIAIIASIVFLASSLLSLFHNKLHHYK